MPLVKYRTDGNNVNEIMVDSNITVSGFINFVNSKSNQTVSRSVFRGKILDNNDLIRNYITSPDQVLTLLTDSSDTDIIDLEHESDETRNTIEHQVSSSIQKRKEGNLKRKGFLYTFTIYTTATPESMLQGHQKEFSLKTTHYILKTEIKSLISSFPEVNYDFEIFIFLAGGVYFNSGTLLDYYRNSNEISYDNIYVLVVKNDGKPIPIRHKIRDPCNCSSLRIREFLSPLCESSLAGLSQIACFLGYVFHGGIKSERILLSLAKITRFAPLVVNLYRFIEKRPLNFLNVLAITSPLFTLFRSMLPPEVKDQNVFEYTLKFMSVFSLVDDGEYLKIFEIDLDNEDDCQKMKLFARYCDDQKLQKNVIVWTADTVNPDFQASLMKPDFSVIENIFETVLAFKPVAPLSLHYIFDPAFVRGKEDNSVMLFIKEVPDKNNFVSIIDPFEGKEKEISIEDLANEQKCEQKDDVFSLIDPNQIDQLIFICFDESDSMKCKFEGGNPKCEVASEFLESLVKQSYALRVSSFFGLISFNSEVKILQPLTAMSSEFIESLKKIHPFGNTLLFDAINLAKQQICEFMRDKNGKTRYPNLIPRIIVITDGEDNGSSVAPHSLVEDLIHNEISVDTVLVSLENRSAACCAISKLTGGLCFRPKSLEEGIRIFEQESFLNLKIRHMNPLPYSEVTSEIFDEETKNFKDNYASYAPNQMIINAQAKVNLATPMYMSYISTKMKIKSYRIMRAFTELNIIARNSSPNYVVYSLHSTPEEWRIFIKGPEETPFSGKWLNMYMTLPSKYPYEPPQFRFLTIPFHPNISAEGTVVFNLNNRNYISTIGIDFIITQIIDLLKNPDQNYAINSEAMNLFANDIAEFNNRQKAGNTGFEDYNQYLYGVKIYSEIPVDAVVLSEERSKSKVVSLTTDAIKKAALKEGEVNDDCLLDINDYEMIRAIGKGSYSYVCLVVDKLMNYEFAAKIPSFNYDGNPIFDYIKEVNIISTFNHGAISKIYGYCLKDFDGNDNKVIIMENVSNGDLQQIIERERNDEMIECWDDTQKLINLYGIASGMAYSASYGITHSDLKTENILMTDELYPKITDFDTARLKEEGFQQSFNMSQSDISSPLYMAPEVIDNDEGYEQYAEKSDVYSFSIIAYEIITSKVPFPDYTKMQLFVSVLNGERPDIPQDTPERYKKLITEAWNQDPNKRPTFQQIADRLRTDEFVKADEVDYERVLLYFDYIDNYKTNLTKSKQIRPKSKADKEKFNSQSEDYINVDEYDKKSLIGKGRFGQVYLVSKKETNQLFAAKVLNQPESPNARQNISTEINIMSKISHPSIIKFVDYTPVDFDGKSKPAIITEYASGSLLDAIENRSNYQTIDDTKKLIIIYGIAAGMSYLHKHSIIHRDVKPENILLDDYFHPFISDFGLSEILVDTEEKDLNIKGTPSYIAPEIWNEQPYGTPADVYSFGILLYELIFDIRAFDGMRPFRISYEVTNGKRPSFPPLLKPNQSVFVPLIEKCWDPDPKKRPTFEEILTELENEKYQTNVDQNEFLDYVKYVRGSGDS